MLPELEHTLHLATETKTARDIFISALLHSASPLEASQALFAYRQSLILPILRQSLAEHPQVLPVWAGNTNLSLFSDTDLSLFVTSTLSKDQEERIYTAVADCQMALKSPAKIPEDVRAPWGLMIRRADDLIEAIAKHQARPSKPSLEAAESLFTSFLQADWTYAAALGRNDSEIQKARGDLDRVFYQIAEKQPEFFNFILFGIRSSTNLANFNMLAKPDVKLGGLRLWQDLGWSSRMLKYLGHPSAAAEFAEKYQGDPELKKSYQTILAIRHCLHLQADLKNLKRCDLFTAVGEQELWRLQAYGGLQDIHLEGRTPRQAFYEESKKLAFALAALKDEIKHVLRPARAWVTSGSITGRPVLGVTDVVDLLATAGSHKFQLSRGELRGLLGQISFNPTSRIVPSEEIRDSLLAILSAGETTGRSLRLCLDSGLLVKIFPTLQAAESHVPNSFHSFPINEHTMRGLELLSELADPTADHDPRFQKLYAELNLEQKIILNTAFLFHDAGYPREAASAQRIDHSIAGVFLVAQELERWSFPAPLITPILTLIEHHRWMSNCSHNPVWFMESEVVQAPEAIKSPDLAKLLCLLTYADLHTTAPEYWNRMEANNIYQAYVKLLEHGHNHPNGKSELAKMQAEGLIVDYPSSFTAQNITNVVEFFSHLPAEFITLSRLTLKSFYELQQSFLQDTANPQVRVFPHRSFASDLRPNDGRRYDILYACENAPGILLKITESLNKLALRPVAFDIFTSDLGTAYGRITVATAEDCSIPEVESSLVRCILGGKARSFSSSGLKAQEISELRIQAKVFPSLPGLAKDPFVRLQVAAADTLAIFPHVLHFLLEQGYDITSAHIARRPDQYLYQIFFDDPAKKPLPTAIDLEQRLWKSF